MTTLSMYTSFPKATAPTIPPPSLLPAHQTRACPTTSPPSTATYETGANPSSPPSHIDILIDAILAPSSLGHSLFSISTTAMTSSSLSPSITRTSNPPRPQSSSISISISICTCTCLMGIIGTAVCGSLVLLLCGVEMGKKNPRKGEPKEGRCGYYLSKKNRYCTQRVTPPATHCLYHGGDKEERVPCPVDPTHTVRAANIDKHVLVCTAAIQAAEREERRNQSAFYVPDVNMPPPPPSPPSLGSIHAAEPDSVVAFLSRLEEAYAQARAGNYGLDIPASVEVHPAIPVTTEGSSARHVAQVSSLVAAMDGEGVVDRDRFLYCEPGAGRGSLCGGVADALGLPPPSAHAPASSSAASTSASSSSASASGPQETLFLLLERESRKLCADRGARADVSVRILEDIKDVDLLQVPALAETDRKLVMIAKHLCGGGTDLALNMVLRSQEVVERTAAILIAQCCFGKISTDTFLGHGFLEELGLGIEYFDWLRVVSEWSTSAPSEPSPGSPEGLPAQEALQVLDDTHITSSLPSPLPSSFSLKSSDHFPASARHTLSRKARYLVYVARGFVLASAGFDVRLIEYVPSSITPQNIALLATRP